MTVYESLCWMQSIQCRMSESTLIESMQGAAWLDKSQSESRERMLVSEACEYAKQAQVLSLIIDTIPVSIAEREI